MSASVKFKTFDALLNKFNVIRFSIKSLQERRGELENSHNSLKCWSTCLSLHGERPGHGGAGEDAPDVEPCGLLDLAAMLAMLAWLAGGVRDEGEEEEEEAEERGRLDGAHDVWPGVRRSWSCHYTRVRSHVFLDTCPTSPGSLHVSALKSHPELSIVGHKGYIENYLNIGQRKSYLYSLHCM